MRVAVCVTVYIDIEPWLHELVRLVRRCGVCSDYCPTRPHCWLYWQNEPQIKAGVPVSISGWDSRNTVGYCGNCGYCGGLETSRRVDITSTGQATAQTCNILRRFRVIVGRWLPRTRMVPGYPTGGSIDLHYLLIYCAVGVADNNNASQLFLTWSCECYYRCIWSDPLQELNCVGLPLVLVSENERVRD